MSDIAKLDISGRRRRRGVICTFFTRLGDKVEELEPKGRLSPMDQVAVKRLQQRLCELNEDFKHLHFTIVNLLEQQEDIEMEQAAFDDHEDRVGNLGNRLQLVLQDEPTRKEPRDPQQKGVLRHLALIQTKMCVVSNAVEAIEPGPQLDHCLLEQHEEQISSLKSELADVLHNIATLDEDETGLEDRKSVISKVIFNMRLQIQRLLQAPAPAPLQEAIKLPKIDVPTFKGGIMGGGHFGSSSMTQSTASRSSPTLSNWLTSDRLSKMAQLDTPSKACQKRQVTIVKLLPCFKSIMIDPAYSIKPLCTW